MQQPSDFDVRAWDHDPIRPRPPVGTIDGDQEPDWMEWLDGRDEMPVESFVDHHDVPDIDDQDQDEDADPPALETVDDRIAVMAADARKVTETRKRRRRRSRYVIGGCAAFVVAVTVGVGVTNLDSTPAPSSTEALPIVGTSTTVAPVAPPSEQGCVARSEGSQASGNGPGDDLTGPGLVLKMQYAMYVSRDADMVRSVLAPSAQAASVDATRAAIAALPPGITHCVWVTTLGPDRYGVKVLEQRTDSTTQLWETTVTTGVQRDGRLLITGITGITAG